MNELKKLVDTNNLVEIKNISPEFCEELFYYCFSKCNYFSEDILKIHILDLLLPKIENKIILNNYLLQRYKYGFKNDYVIQYCLKNNLIPSKNIYYCNNCNDFYYWVGDITNIKYVKTIYFYSNLYVSIFIKENILIFAIITFPFGKLYFEYFLGYFLNCLFNSKIILITFSRYVYFNPIKEELTKLNCNFKECKNNLKTEINFLIKKNALIFAESIKNDDTNIAFIFNNLKREIINFL